MRHETAGVTENLLESAKKEFLNIVRRFKWKNGQIYNFYKSDRELRFSVIFSKISNTWSFSSSEKPLRHKFSSFSNS